MRRHDDAWRVVAGLAAAGGCALLVQRAATSVGRLVATAGAVPPAVALTDLVGAAVVGLGAGVAAWYAVSGLVVAACGVARWAGRPWLRAERASLRWGAPVLRRLVGTAAGVALGAGIVAGPAGAVSVRPPDDLGWSPTTTQTTGGTATGTAAEPPGSPPAAATPSPGTAERPSEDSTEDSTHLVRPGDSLWRVAAARLAARGDPATDAATAAEWPRWYAANRGVIGPDPDLLRPGQVLTPPVEP